MPARSLRCWGRGATVGVRGDEAQRHRHASVFSSSRGATVQGRSAHQKPLWGLCCASLPSLGKRAGWPVRLQASVTAAAPSCRPRAIVMGGPESQTALRSPDPCLGGALQARPGQQPPTPAFPCLFSVLVSLRATECPEAWAFLASVGLLRAGPCLILAHSLWDTGGPPGNNENGGRDHTANVPFAHL